MRRTKFSFVCLAMLSLAACSQSYPELTGTDSDAQGQVKISLSAEERSSAQTKATTDSDLPDVDDFTVEIFKVSDNKRIYRDTYANTAGMTIYLNTGDFLLSAWHGDSLGVGFDAAFYAAKEQFTVEQQTTAQVSAVAKLSNVKVAVVFGATLQHDYDTFYAVVRSRDNSKYEIEFEQDEERAGYLPSGDFTFELWVNDEGTWKYFSYDAGYCAMNDFVTFYVDTEHGEGSFSLTVTIDTGTDLIEKNIDVPFITLPKDAPEINVSGFDENDSAQVIEAVDLDTDELRADVVAYGTIEHLYLNVNSTYLSNAGIPSEVDLANIDDSTAELLKAQGFKWSQPAGHPLCYVDFYGILTKLYDEHYDSSNPFSAQISLTVEDTKGRTYTTDTYTITNAAPEFSYSINDYDIWARRLTNQTVTCTVGNPEVITIQYKAEGDSEWTTASETPSVSGNTVTYDRISGLAGDTNYSVRAIYNGDEAGAIAIDITTEEEAQTGNADFEDWATLSKHISVTLGTNYDQTYWQPYDENDTDPWWASNGGETIITSITGLTTAGHWMKCFPCIGPSVDTPSGEGKSAHLITVNLGNANTAGDYVGTTHIGEIFIGTTNTDGDHVTDGHSFPSRPDKIVFDYEYEPWEEQAFCVEVNLYDSDDALIASYSTDAGPTTHLAWDTFEADLDYSVLTKKAASIYISFKASNITKGTSSSLAGNGNCGKGTSSSEVEFDGETLEAHVGCFLWIDNVRLVYE